MLTAIVTLSTASSAQDAHNQQNGLEKDISALNQQIAAKQQQITALRNKPSPEQAELVAAQKVLNDARVELKKNPGAENEGKARNAEFKLKLAQLKFDKSNGDIETLNDDIDKLKQQASAKQQQIKELSRQASDQAADVQQQKLADERAKRQQQEQELARTKQEAESAQKEIERLKAALAAKEAVEAKAAAAVPTAKVVEIPQPAEVAKAEAPRATPAAASAATTSANGISKLNSQDQVLRELQAMAQRVAQAGRGGDTTNLVLYMKQPGATATNKDKITLRALGNNQYRGNAKIEPGQYEATMGFNRWPVEFAGNEGGETVFLCDNSDAKKPRLLIYNSALEGGAK
ncbi:MAG TPA: hypothetical protein VGK97_03925 [Spongiibacteraceae bacterium]